MFSKYSRLLYFGPSTWGSTCLQRFNALRSLFEVAYYVDSRRVFPDKKAGRTLLHSLQGRLGYGPVIKRSEEILIQEAARFKPDMLWIDGGFLVSDKALESIRHQFNCFLVHYTPDSLAAPGMSNRCMRKAVAAYDAVVTTKQQDIPLYKHLCARRIIFSLQGYDPSIHRPAALSTDERRRLSCDVSFIGQYMKDRAAVLNTLSCYQELNLRLYGTGWNCRAASPKLKSLFYGPAVGDEYAKAICASRISLGFLNHLVGDTYTTRTFEIPACAGFFLAERTEMHQQLFLEDSEAVFFSSVEELKDKIRFYLKHDKERKKIANAGYRKVTSTGYTWRHLTEKTLYEIQQ